MYPVLSAEECNHWFWKKSIAINSYKSYSVRFILWRLLRCSSSRFGFLRGFEVWWAITCLQYKFVFFITRDAHLNVHGRQGKVNWASATFCICAARPSIQIFFLWGSFLPWWKLLRQALPLPQFHNPLELYKLRIHVVSSAGAIWVGVVVNLFPIGAAQRHS